MNNDEYWKDYLYIWMWYNVQFLGVLQILFMTVIVPLFTLFTELTVGKARAKEAGRKCEEV